MVEWFDALVREVGDWGYLLLGLASLIEFLAPPFPGDTIILLGGAWAARGQRSVALVLLATTVGGMVGITANYLVGHWVGRKILAVPHGRMLFGVTTEKIREAQEKMRSNGTWLLIINRFLPTFRSVLFIAAGAAHMSYRRVLALGTVSTILWNCTLLAVGITVGGNAESVEQFLREYKLWAFLAVGALALAVGARLLWRRAPSA